MPEQAVTTEPSDQTDWEKVARNALANGASAGLHKLNRRLLVNLCESLASGVPYPTAARIPGLRPETVAEWHRIRPRVGAAIDFARGKGELLRINRIGNASDWKAQDRLLQLQQPAYAESGAQASGGGPQINVTINVPLPEAVAAGDRPMIDITPQCTPQDVESQPANVGQPKLSR